MTDRGSLRQQLRDMRSHLLDNLDQAISSGDLALLAGINAALIALDDDAAGPPDDAELADRAVVGDDGDVIRLMLYCEDGAVAAVALDPVRAVRLATRLLDVARRRL